MQFKHPEILYALLLLLIPIIVHLFQLRRFQKIPFTNVQFLKQITLQTRKSSQIKKWLILLTRLLLLSGIILAFAQPYTSNLSDYKTKNETVIYLDNSFSMQAKGKSGALLQRAIQEIIDNLNSEDILSIVTNNREFKNISINNIKNELLQIGYSSNQLDYKSAFLKAKNCFSNDAESLKNLVFISDFQESRDFFDIDVNPDYNLSLVQLQPVNTANINVDSLYVSNRTSTNLDLTAVLKNQGERIEDLSVSLYNDETLIAKSSIDIADDSNITFTVGNNDFVRGEVKINDSQLQFDNSLFFSINKPEKINVLAISESDDSFLRKIYSKTEFNYTRSSLNALDYNRLSSQNLVILNELKTIPNSLQEILIDITERDGHVLIIPSIESDLSSYNQLLTNFSLLNFKELKNVERRIFKINYSHRLFKDVFSNQITNFQYPKVNNAYPISFRSASNILNFEDGSPFLISSDNIFVFTAPLNKTNSNFQNSSLIVPTFYNIGKQSLQLARLYYTIGQNNEIDINTALGQDQVLKLENENIKIIPQQQSFNNKVAIRTSENPEIAGNYRITSNSETFGTISFNYNRKESNLSYMNFNNYKNEQISDSVAMALSKINSNTKINELWKWFIIFACIMLVLEMFILKFYK